MLPMFILQAEENLVEKPWGGEFIAKLKGVGLKKIGESWEFSAHPSRPSKVAVDGVMSMLELIERYGRDVIDGFKEFPILVKIIDANDNLSVQVHPSEEQAKELGERDHGKPEAWVVLDADEGAKIYLGFKRDVDPDEFRKAVEKGGDVLDYLNSVEVRKGDAFYIPAGTIHALGKGVRVLEVSTNSNITYRIYDYGRGRELHLDKAFKVLNFNRTDVDELRQRPKRTNGTIRLVDTEKFKVDKVISSGKLKNEVFQIMLCVSGGIRLKTEEESVEVGKGRSVLIPAITKEFEIELSPNSEVYTFSPVKV